MNIARFIALATVLAFPTAALAQPNPEHIQPGTPLDTTFIAPRTDSLVILDVHEGDTVRAGYGVLETRTHVVDGARRVVHVERLFIEGVPDPAVADSVHMHWGTLLPISAHTRGDVPHDLHFGPGGVRVIALPRPDWDSSLDSTVSEVALAEPVFYLAPFLLLRVLPLRAGYRAVIPVVTQEGELGKMRVAVTGEGTARALDGAACPVLVVEVEDGNNEGTFHISPVNRSIIRLDSPYGALAREAGCP
jgi:hypothetical protein